MGVALAIHEPVKRWRDEDIHAPCEIPFATATITANGDVWACCMPGTIMGNLNEQSLSQIWNGPAFAAFRKRVNTPNPPAPCRNCGLSHVLVRNNRRAYAPDLHAKPGKDEPGEISWLRTLVPRQRPKKLRERRLFPHQRIQLFEARTIRRLWQRNQLGTRAVSESDLVPLDRRDRVVEPRHGAAAENTPALFPAA